jgi:hypothetical protein
VTAALDVLGGVAAAWLALVVGLTGPRATISKSRAVAHLRRAVVNPGLNLAGRADTAFTRRRLQSLQTGRSHHHAP